VIDVDAACRSLDIGCQLIVGANRAERTGMQGSRQRPSGTSLAWVLPHLVAHVAARGRDATPIRRLPGLRAKNFDDPDTRVADLAVDAWRLAAKSPMTTRLVSWPGDRQGPRRPQYRPLDSTLGSALEQLARYGQVINDRAGARPDRDDAIAVT
jgi:hypothetical protein